MKVLVFGTFDRLHPGHEFLLREAQKRACLLSGQGELYVVVARDANVVRVKGRPPEQLEGERVRAIEQTLPQAHVVLGDPNDFLAPVYKIQPELILLGYDQKLPPGVSQDDLPCPIERLPAYEPQRYKSSLRRSDTALP